MPSPHALGTHGGPVIGTYRNWVRGELPGYSAIDTWLNSCDDGLVLRLLAGPPRGIYPLKCDSALSTIAPSNTLESFRRHCLPNPNVRLEPQFLGTQGPQVRPSRRLNKLANAPSTSLETRPPLGCSSAYVKSHGDGYGQDGFSNSAPGVYQVQGGFGNGSPFSNRKGNSGNSSRGFDRSGSGDKDGSQSMAGASVQKATKLECPYLICEHRTGRKGTNGCELLFPNFNALRIHVLDVHVKARQCRKCYRKFFGTVKALGRHEANCGATAAPSNPVRRKVLEFSDQIEKCKNLPSLTRILYPGGIKQFDRLDGTDNLGRSTEGSDDVTSVVGLLPSQAIPQLTSPAVHPQKTALAPSMAPIFSSTSEGVTVSPDLAGRYIGIPNGLLVQDSPSTVGDNSNLNFSQDFRQDSTLSREQDANASDQGEQGPVPAYDNLTAFADELGFIGTFYPSSSKHLLRQFKRKLPSPVRKQVCEVFLEELGEKGFGMVGAIGARAASSVSAIESGYRSSSTPGNPDPQTHGGHQGARIYSDQNNPIGPVSCNLPGPGRDHDMKRFSTTDASSVAGTDTESVAYSWYQPTVSNNPDLQAFLQFLDMDGQVNSLNSDERRADQEDPTLLRKKRPRRDYHNEQGIAGKET